MQNDSGLIQAHIFKSHRRANHVCGQAHNPALSGTMTKPVTDRRTTDHRVTDRCTTETSTTDRYAKSKRMNDRQAVSSIGILPVVLLLASCSDRSRYASPDANIATLADAKHVRVLYSPHDAVLNPTPTPVAVDLTAYITTGTGTLAGDASWALQAGALQGLTLNSDDGTL